MTQRIAVAISCIIFYYSIKSGPASPAIRYCLLAVLSALACVEKLGSIMNLVAVERDWVVVIAAEEESLLAGLAYPCAVASVATFTRGD